MKTYLTILITLLLTLSVNANVKTTEELTLIWDSATSPAASVIYASYSIEKNVNNTHIFKKTIITESWVRAEWLNDYVYFRITREYIEPPSR